MQQYKETPVEIVGGCDFGRYQKISKAELWNMYISDGWLLSFSGWKKVLTVTAIAMSSGRGAFVSTRNNIIIAVINNSVYTVDDGFTVRFIGRIKTSVGPVSIDENLADQIAIVDGLHCYIYNTEIKSLTLQVFDKDKFIPNYVVYHNAAFLFGNGVKNNNGSKWFQYRNNSATTIALVEEFSLQTKPDYALAVVRLPGSSDNVMVFGSTVAEIWTNVGGATDYQRNSSLNIDYGCLSVSTIATDDKYVMWLAANTHSDPVIMIFTGNQATTVSTAGISTILGRIKYPSQSSASFFKKDGHLFYILTFYNPVDNLTFCYDIDSKQFSFLTDSNMDYFPATNILYFNGNTYFFSLKNGSMYNIDTSLTTYDENIGSDDNLEDAIIPRIRVTPPIRYATSNRFRSRNLNIIIDQGNDEKFQGLSLKNVQGIPYKPRVDMSFSIDGNYTFNKPQSQVMRFLGVRKNIFNYPGPFGLCNEISFKLRFITKSFVCLQNGTLEVW
jgi:hypothetical protein